MKNLFFGVLVIVLSWIQFPAMSQSVEVKLEGSWRLELSEIMANLSPSKRNKFNKLSVEKQLEFKESISSREFTFLKDGVFKAFWKFKDKSFDVNGNWKLGENDKELIISFPGNNSIYTIKRLDDFLILIPQNSKRGLLEELIFKKSI